MKLCALELDQLHLAFGKHRADDLVPVRKVEAVEIHLRKGVIFQAASFQRMNGIRERAIGHQGCPLDLIQAAVLKIQRLH